MAHSCSKGEQDKPFPPRAALLSQPFVISPSMPFLPATQANPRSRSIQPTVHPPYIFLLSLVFFSHQGTFLLLDKMVNVTYDSCESLPWPLCIAQSLVLSAGDLLWPDGNGVYNLGDIAWTLASTALVWIMVPGVGFFYSGLLRRKNALSMIYLSMMTIAVVSFQVGSLHHTNPYSYMYCSGSSGGILLHLAIPRVIILATFVSAAFMVTLVVLIPRQGILH